MNILGISRQRVYQLLQSGKLDGIAVMRKGALVAFYVTESLGESCDVALAEIFN